MNILLIDQAANTEYAKKYMYYNGLYEGLVQLSSEIEDLNLFFTNETVIDVDHVSRSNNINFDAVVFGLGWFGSTNYFGKIKCNNSKKIVYLFKPQNDLDKKLEFCKTNEVDLIITPIPSYKDFERTTGIKTVLFPYGVFDNIFKPDYSIEKVYDVGFSGALHQNRLYPNGEFESQNLRSNIKQRLDEINDVKIFWKSSDVYETARIHDTSEYVKTINQSKIWIATNASHGDVTPRYYEVLSSGTLLFCEEIHDEYKGILIDGFNCIEFKNNLSNFEEKLRHYTENDKERETIVKNALNTSKQNTWKYRAKKLLDLIEEI